MKIGITCYPTYGGSGVIASELGRILAGRGHEIHFISYALPMRLFNYQQNIYFHEVGETDYPLFEHQPYTLSLATRMLEVAGEADLDILHVHYAIPHAISAYLAKQVLGKKKPAVITTLHGTDITLVGNDRVFFPITKFSIERSDGVTCVSKFLKEKTIEFFKIEKPMEVIYNFVDTGKFLPSGALEVREKFAGSDEKIIFHVSNFRPVKRLADIIKIFSLIRKKVKSKLVLIGDGPDRQKAEILAEELNLKKHVIFPGKQDCIECIMPLADLFLLPSETESFGVAALEAMSCGVPVVASKVGGLTEVIAGGETGFLLPPGEVEAMAAAAIKIFTDERLAEKMKESSRSRAVKIFDAERVVPRYERYYNKILELN